MLELEERLAAELRAIGDEAEPSDRLDGLVRQRSARRVRRRRLATVSTMGAAAVVLLVGAVGLVSRNTGGQGAVVTGADDPPLFLVPAQVPEGLTLTHAAGGGRPDAGGGAVVGVDVGQGGVWDGTQRWVRFDGGGHPADVVDVRWGDVTAVEDPLGDGPGTPTTVRGHEGTLSSSGAVLSWTEAQGVTVAITGTTAYRGDSGAGREPLDPAVLTGFADALVARDGGGFDVATPPAGFEPVGEVPGDASTGSDPRALVYSGPNQRQVVIDVVDGADIAPGMNLVWTAARRVEVRGRAAVLSPGLVSAPAIAGTTLDPATDRYLQWEEPTGELVLLAGVGLTETELLDLAASLEEVDAATWFALQDQGEPGGETAEGETPGGESSGPPESPPASDVPVPVVGEPAPGAQQVTGTYSGTERYSLGGTDCGVSSTLDAEFTLTDGTVWAYRADYCGEVDGDDWVSQTGDGVFTLDGGSTLTVEMPFQRLPLDTDGAPYALTITGGTGTFAGASGTCQLDNHLTDVAFGTQQQDGAFVCDITP